MEISSLGSILSLLGGGGAIGFFLTYLARIRKSSLDELRDVIKDRKEEIERLRRLEAENTISIRALESKLSSMESKILLMESAHYDLPLPQWLKDMNGTMLSLNAEYERIFLKPLDLRSSQYIGKNDSMVWGEDIARHFRIMDHEVMRKQTHVFTVETIPDASGICRKWEILKYPRFAGNVMIGVGGIALRPIDK